MIKLSEMAKTAIAGSAAGAVNGLFGAGGGMILVPALSLLTDLQEEEIFPASISIILPACIISLIAGSGATYLRWLDMAPYLVGSLLGGILAGWLGKHIPTKYLHRVLGIFILYGGIKYLW